MHQAVSVLDHTQSQLALVALVVQVLIHQAHQEVTELPQHLQV
jgi:hypothetical protein